MVSSTSRYGSPGDTRGWPLTSYHGFRNFPSSFSKFTSSASSTNYVSWKDYAGVAYSELNHTLPTDPLQLYSYVDVIVIINSTEQ